MTKNRREKTSTNNQNQNTNQFNSEFAEENNVNQSGKKNSAAQQNSKK